MSPTKEKEDSCEEKGPQQEQNEQQEGRRRETRRRRLCKESMRESLSEAAGEEGEARAESAGRLGDTRL